MLANFRRVSAQRCSPISDLTFFFPPEGKGNSTSSNARTASRFRSRSCLSSMRSKVNLFMIALKYSLDTRHNARERSQLAVISFPTTFSRLYARARATYGAREPLIFYG